MNPLAVVEWCERRQIPLYLGAIAAGGVIGSLAPGAAPGMARAIDPLLMVLLFATFLAVPLIEVGRSFRDIGFLRTILVTNFVVNPIVVWGLSRFVADDRGLLVGVLLVLLTPCVDYVIVFTGIAGGAKERLLAATPLLMLAQMATLPVNLYLFAGADTLVVVDLGHFVGAFIRLIIVPLAAAAAVQGLARRHRSGRLIETAMAGAMVPLMMATLAVVVGSQIAGVGSRAMVLWRVVPIYLAFVVIAMAIGLFAGRLARLGVSSTRAVMFSTSTRNSLVVLPLALALPASLSIAPLAVVTQTLVELVALVVLVRWVPVIVPSRREHPRGRPGRRR